MRFVVIFFVFASSVNYGQSLDQGKKPVWVTDYPFNETLPEAIETKDGYAYLLVTFQSNLETKEFYRKYVMKVTSESGLSIVSSINEHFDPSYQKLIFHELTIIRNGKKINRLDPAKFDVIRREEEMSRAIYDKTLTAIYNMPDVRVGDILEYSFTRVGFNPVFKNYRFGSFYLQYKVPVAKFAHKLIYDSHRKLDFKMIGKVGNSAESIQGPMVSKEWVRENVPALLTDDLLPSWYNPYPHIQFSDFETWNQLKSWAQSVYIYPVLRNGELKYTIDKLKSSNKSEEEKIRECIRIAQADIRYLSFSDGIHGYKPHEPALVYEQKYGDCKDKSFLLSFMLNNIGIKSAPALVSTENGYTLPTMLPSPWAFDHCIVQFTHHDSIYWVDPTLNRQVGPLKSYSIPSYYHALVIDKSLSHLDEIPFGYRDSHIEVNEDYSMYEVGGYVSLKVRTTYYGDEADEIRSYFRSHTKEEVSKNYLNFYAKDFSDLSLIRDVEFADDTIQNIFTSSEEYKLKNFWTIENDNKTATIYASVLATYLNKPTTRLREMPLWISHPRNVLQTIKIHLPEEWKLDESTKRIESDGFIYERFKSYSNKTITMRYLYKTKTDFVEAVRTLDHIEKIDEALKDNGITIYKPLQSTTANSSNLYIIIAIVAVLGLYLAKKKFSG